MAIYVVDGKPRHGKTAWLMSKVPGWLKECRDSGRRIFSNVYIDLKQIRWIRKKYKDPKAIIGDIMNKKDRENKKKLLFYWRNIDEWNFMRQGTIICDEATRYFNARKWMHLNEDTEIQLQQHGKESLDIWLTTQHFSRLDTTLRVLVERFFRVERVLGWGNTTYISRISEHYLEDLERYERNPAAFQKKPGEDGEDNIEEIYYEYLFIWGRIKRLYDTKQQVLASRPMPLKHEARYCPDPHCKLHKKAKITHS